MRKTKQKVDYLILAPSISHHS